MNSFYKKDEYKSPPLPLFQLIIGGLGKIDLADWKTNTRLKHCTSESNVVRWFWQAVEAFSEERRGRLLQFVTGSTRVPLQGFKALQGGSCTGSESTQRHTSITIIISSTQSQLKCVIFECLPPTFLLSHTLILVFKFVKPFNLRKCIALRKHGISVERHVSVDLLW